MKNLLALAALASALVCSSANAAKLVVKPGLQGSANNVYSIYLAGEATAFNGVGLSVKPIGADVLADVTTGNVAGAPRPAGDSFSYRNRILDADPGEIPGGKQWNLLGVLNTPQEIAFNGGPIGQSISTAAEPNGELFLANIKLPNGTAQATAALQLVNGVDTAYTETLTFGGVPEPMSFGLAGIAMIGGLALRRRAS